MSLDALTSLLDEEIEDPDEETFLLYSQPIPSQNLGFIDPTAQTLGLNVAGRDVIIHQSPSILSSTRAGGTTGAVLWKVTPACADWLAAKDNIFFASGVLNNTSTVIELGCGISPLNGLALSTRVARYVLTDQPYVQKLIQRNLEENNNDNNNDNNNNNNNSPSTRTSSKSKRPPRHHKQPQPDHGSVIFKTLDWESDQVTPSLLGDGFQGTQSFDAVLACDCVFNYALIDPLIQASVDVCRLRQQDASRPDGPRRPCLCIVAQQLRNDDVFQSWLTAFRAAFHVWRLPDHALPERLRPDAGFVVHLGILRD